MSSHAHNDPCQLPVLNQPLPTKVVWAYDPASVPKSALAETGREPCPFCGEQGTGLSHCEGKVVVRCNNCGAVGPGLQDEADDWNENDFRAILLWNNRGKMPTEAEYMASLAGEGNQSELRAEPDAASKFCMSLDKLSQVIANWIHMPYCWEDIKLRLTQGRPLPVKFSNIVKGKT